MSPRTLNTTTAVLALAIGLACLPACKKTAKPTEADSPNTPNTPNAGPGGPPGPGVGVGANPGRDPLAPRSPVFSSTGEAVARRRAQNDLKMILLAIHAYHDSVGSFPAGYADKDGKPGLSWRVALLPYLEQGPLFQAFKLDEPWDSPTNKPLVSRMPPIFAPAGASTNGYTFYRGFSGPNTWLPPQQQTVRPGQPLRGVRMADFVDGTSNTVVVAEAYEPVVWTKPEEMAFAPNSLPKLGGVFASGFLAGLASGEVRFIRNGISAKTLANAIQINDGNPVDLDN